MNVTVVSTRVLIRKAVCALLVATGSFASVNDIKSVLSITDLPNESKPQLIVLHTVKHSTAIEATCQSRDLLPEVRILLLLDERPRDEFWVEALHAGAWGCLSTSESPQHLHRALMKVAEGERWVPQRVTNLIIEKLVSAEWHDDKSTRSLTRREWEVLALLANGYSDKEIAAHLYVSPETAKSHVKAIYRKLQVRGRRGAAVYYYQNFHSLSARSRGLGAKSAIFPTKS